MPSAIRALGLSIGIFASALVAQDQPGTRADAQDGQMDLQQLLARMEETSVPHASVLLEMVSSGPYPGGSSFEVTGTVRVLRETHLHLRNVSRFEGDVEVEHEVVRTPEGIWVREKDPSFGEVFYRIDRELVGKIEKAEAELGVEGGLTGTRNPVHELRGAEMLRNLAEQFELDVNRQVIDGREYYVVAGPARGEAPDPELGDLPAPDRVELLVRIPDLIIMQTTFFADGKPLMQMSFKRLELDVPMDPKSFAITLPPGAQFIDAMSFLPFKTEVEGLFERAEAKRAEAENGEKKSGG